jgi:plastocyanin domain-containing protein
MIIIANFIILALIGFIIWWFWILKVEPLGMIDGKQETITIENGVYKPNKVVTTVGQPLTLNFIAKDKTLCAKKIIIPGFNAELDLSKGMKQSITITPQDIGEYTFSCPLSLYKGVIEVRQTAGVSILVSSSGYQPPVIKVHANQPVTLEFIRIDPSRCTESIHFPELKLSKELSFHQPSTIILNLPKAGVYHFICELGTLKGKIIAS